MKHFKLILAITTCFLVSFNMMSQGNDVDKVKQLQKTEKEAFDKETTTAKGNLEKEFQAREETLKEQQKKDLERLNPSAPEYKTKLELLQKSQKLDLTNLRRTNDNERATFNTSQKVKEKTLLQRQQKTLTTVQNRMNDPKFKAQQEGNKKLNALANERNALINKTEEKKKTLLGMQNKANQAQNAKALKQDGALAKKTNDIENKIQKQQAEKLKKEKAKYDKPLTVNNLVGMEGFKDKAQAKNVKETTKLLAKADRKSKKESLKLDKQQAKDKAKLKTTTSKTAAKINSSNKKEIKAIASKQKSKTKKVISSTKKKVKKATTRARRSKKGN